MDMSATAELKVDSLAVPGATTKAIPTRVPVTFRPDLEVGLYVRIYENEIGEMVERDWSVGLLTIVPDRVTLDRLQIPNVIRDPVDRIYDRFVTRVGRQRGVIRLDDKKGIPFLIGAANLPDPEGWSGAFDKAAPKRHDGLYFLGLLAVPPKARLGARSVSDHLVRHSRLYRSGGGIDRISLQTVEPRDIFRALRRCFASIYRRDIGFDEGLVVLPRTLPTFAN